ncbi:hypothetical protein BZG01_03145 [Labilibaculum manganireducens]|uniref:TIGR02453 family protein n=1 Tax=Labilibaculum manganireducens TaxID=1940525 RepID=A0A2N3IEL6_9BACT|nr:DUF2461 domain-containing protein [Labilibaculum manganireducens]PKQ68728.1 hypothetical protein BZG01_03145 [Labilibaculum manganireducens]
MLSNSIYEFLLELRENNNRDWFHANKKKYDKAKKDFELFVELSIEQIKVIDPDLSGLNAKDCIFRIFRDVRFSENKQPYKTHFGAFLSKNGRKSKYGGYYIHIEPGGSFLGGGCYMPAPNVLKAIREEIFHNPLEFQEIITNKEFSSHFPEMYGEKLKTAPRGYPKDFEYIDLLNFKNYAVGKMVPDRIVLSEQFSDEILECFTSLRTLNTYLNEILADL